MIPAWALVEAVLTAEECAQVIEAGRANLKCASTGNGDDKKRRGSISWFANGEQPEIDRLMQKCVTAFGDGVRAFLGLHLASVEPIQFTHYGPGDFYGWHYDAHACPDRPPRHFSATVELSDPKTFKGGGLEFHSIENPRPEKKQGRMIIFPSLLLHRALEVRDGHRSSLVLWGHA